jgi:hypothetical protein
MSITIAILFLLAVGSAPTGAAGWPQFRGPTGDGLAASADPPVQWSETKNVRWKVAVPGRGRSSPVVAGDRIWLTTAIEQGIERKRIGPDDMQTAEHISIGAVCLDSASGKMLWRVALYDLDNPQPVHWLNSFATPTPVIEAGRLYCDFGAFGTACLDAAGGKVLWKQQLSVDHQVGPGSSPIIYGDLLVLVRDGRDAQYVAALDKNTGKNVWKSNRPPLKASTGDFKKSFSTPLVIQEGGQTQMVVPGAQWVVSYNPVLGKELWRVRYGENFSLASRPVFGRGLALISTGCFTPELWAIRVDGQGDVSNTHVAWKARGNIPVISSPIVVGDEVYCVSDAGIVSCFDVQSGKSLWRERLGGSHLASPVCAAGRLYFFDQGGKATVLKAGRELARLADNKIEGTLVATPAIVDRAIYLRTDTHLYRIEGGD